MRSTSSPQVFVDRLRKTAENVADVPRQMTTASALVVKNAVLAETQGVAPGLRLRGVRGSGKIGVRFVLGSSSQGKASALVMATGPFHLIERDTAPHDIYPRGLAAKTARGRASGKKALAGPNFGPVASAHVSGSKGKHPFEKGVERARPLTGAAARSALHRALAKELG